MIKKEDKNAMLRLICSRMKKNAISEVMGYILLISFTLIMSFLVYQGLRTYVPEKAIECPEGVSIFVKNYSCTPDGGGGHDLILFIKNNGRHNIAGYFIHYTNNSGQTVATKNLVGYLNKTESGVNNTDFNNAVIFQAITTQNFVNVSSIAYAKYNNIPEEIYSIDLLPIRFQKQSNKLRMVSCGKATVREKITCT